MPDKTTLIAALEKLSAEREARLQSLDELRAQAQQHLAVGDTKAAQGALEELTRSAPQDAEAWQQLAERRLENGDPSGARAAILEAIRLHPSRASYHLSYAKTAAGRAAPDSAYLALLGMCEADLPFAIASRQHHNHGDDSACCVEWANLHFAAGDGARGRQVLETALRREIANCTAWENLGDAWRANGDETAAARSYGMAAYYAADYATAATFLERFLNHTQQKLAAIEEYRALMVAYSRLGQFRDCARVYREGAAACGETEPLLEELAAGMARSGDTLGSISWARHAAERFPDNKLLQLRARLSLRQIYHTESELLEYRRDFRAGLEAIRSAAIGNLDKALHALENWTNFYLPYQGYGDRDLHEQYGDWVTRIMQAAYPQWRERAMPVREGRLRIGYVSQFFRTHSVANTTIGWLRHHDAEAFEVFTYNIGPVHDAMSAQFERCSDHYRHLRTGGVEAIARRIAEDNLHLLVYPDIGMAPRSAMLAALRLAPVQCSSWGHPVTSGLAAVDCFLSGDLMEPADAGEHYSERLIRLPNLGVAYEWPGVPEGTARRTDFGIPETATVYLSCQTLQKYHPRYDFLYAEIARRVPQARFVFLEDCGQLTKILRDRLEVAFANVGLKAAEFCQFLPQQHYPSYLQLMRVADVFLDTPGWSGANTAYEAAAMGLPMVTLPGEFMRGRHCRAILSMMDLAECIAVDAQEYIAIAARLGSDAGWRDEIRKKVAERRAALYGDRSAVDALENFYREAVAGRFGAGA